MRSLLPPTERSRPLRDRRVRLLSARPEIPEALRPSANRLRALRAAWAAVAPACAEASARELAESEHATRRHFWSLAKRGGSLETERIGELGVLLDELHHTLCDAAFGAPVERVRAALRRDREAHPKRLLTLIDLLALAAFREPDRLRERLTLVDVLITLACTEGDSRRRVAPHDPVNLSPVLRKLTQRADDEYGEETSALEAEFFAAANVAADVRDPSATAGLRTRKARLGRAYFAPGLLRAVITYNMALEQARQPWTCLPDGEPAPTGFAPPASCSVFASDALAALHGALRERLAGKPPGKGPVHRVAWALEVDSLDPDSLACLDRGSLAASDLRCGVILVGLLARALPASRVALEEIGIPAATVAEEWVEELDQLVKIEVHGSILGSSSGKTCDNARALSDLRNRFLFDAIKTRPRAKRIDPDGARAD